MITISLVTCEICGKKVSEFYAHDSCQWWAMFVTPDEGEICLDCIRQKVGFDEAFLESVGIGVDDFVKFSEGRHAYSGNDQIIRLD